MRFKIKAAVLAIVVFIFVVGFAASRFSLAALEEPSRMEISLATAGKHFLISRASRHGVPSPDPPNIGEGNKLYGTECAICHGQDAHKPTDAGRWMYPRAADLTSIAVQQYSDRELFWIVKNGIKLSGMPAFGAVETDQHIWQMVQYLRSVGQQNQ
jgi:mono/diheme cytochrome c family protein